MQIKAGIILTQSDLVGHFCQTQFVEIDENNFKKSHISGRREVIIVLNLD